MSSGTCGISQRRKRAPYSSAARSVMDSDVSGSVSPKCRSSQARYSSCPAECSSSSPFVLVQVPLVVEREQLEELPQAARDDVEIALVAEEDHRQRRQILPVVAAPQRVERAGAGGLGEGDEPAEEGLLLIQAEPLDEARVTPVVRVELEAVREAVPPGGALVELLEEVQLGYGGVRDVGHGSGRYRPPLTAAGPALRARGHPATEGCVPCGEVVHTPTARAPRNGAMRGAAPIHGARILDGVFR